MRHLAPPSPEHRSTPTESEELPLHATPHPIFFPHASGAKAVHV
ncbi:hypothetical protein BRPE64_ACDS22430 [Caballeronia insecticola]|uniref:Uncharacterized protein n=1 Tax=Caballeronia insecticola TaxID=758793 RepID=R4WZR0_9BURK|nr:hypothetical protein BRPE64_ACDS22430 [Caballeronia insecticola]